MRYLRPGRIQRKKIDLAVTDSVVHGVLYGECFSGFDFARIIGVLRRLF